MRYLISLIFFLLGLISALFIGEEVYFLTYVDIPIFIYVVLFPFLFVSIIFGFKEMAAAFLILKEKNPEKEKLEKALEFFKVYGKTTWIIGSIIFVISVIQLLRNTYDYSAFFPNLSVDLISLLYCGIINALIIPFTVFIKKRLKE